MNTKDHQAIAAIVEYSYKHCIMSGFLSTQIIDRLADYMAEADRHMCPDPGPHCDRTHFDRDAFIQACYGVSVHAT